MIYATHRDLMDNITLDMPAPKLRALAFEMWNHDLDPASLTDLAEGLAIIDEAPADWLDMAELAAEIAEMEADRASLAAEHTERQ